MKKLGWLAAGLVLTTGCAGTTVTRSGQGLPPRGEGCAFEVFTVPPEGFVEIGAIDITASGYDGRPYNIPALQKLIAKDVCEMGGDAILTRGMSGGAYTFVTILHRAPATPAASAAAPVAAPAAALGDGCHYDTQCKGDRICSGGQCVNPPTK